MAEKLIHSPNKLTCDECAKICSHPIDGAKLLGSFSPKGKHERIA
ncbi:MAG: hypothetical protein ACOX0U_06275 [Oscillospiraceae bacterium]